MIKTLLILLEVYFCTLLGSLLELIFPQKHKQFTIPVQPEPKQEIQIGGTK